MKIAIPVPSVDHSLLSIDQSLETYAWETLFEEHDVLKLPLDRVPGEDILSRVADRELIVWPATMRPKDGSKSWIDELNQKLSRASVTLTGFPALWLSPKRFSTMEPRFLLCPVFPSRRPLFSRTGQLKAWLRELHGRLNAVHPTLWLAGNQSDVCLGAKPGAQTLICPEFPQVAAKAIASAKAVLSFSMQPSLIALASGVPTFLVCTDEKTTKLAQDLAIPFMLWNPEQSPEKVAHAFDNVIKNYPWETVRPALERNKTEFIKQLRSHELVSIGYIETSQGTKAYPIRRADKPSSPPLRFCCIADEKYLPFFAGLVENLLEVHGDNLEAHLLGLGNQTAQAASSLFPRLKLHTYSLEDIWTLEELEQVKAYSVGLRAVSSKPRLLRHLINNFGAEPIFFFDLDLFFFRSPRALIENLGDASVLLFPQWSDRFEWMRFHGMFNTGLIVAKRGAEPLMDWWAKQCLNGISYDISTGHYMDQACLELGILYFDGIKIGKRLDENVAPWNRKTLKVTSDPYKPWRLVLNGGNPVGSYHAAGPDNSGYFEIKYAWDQMATFFSNIKEPDTIEPFYANILEQQRLHWNQLNQLLRERARITERLHIKLKNPNPRIIAKYLDGWGSRMMVVWDLFYRGYRLLRSPFTPKFSDCDPAQRRWIESQQEALFPAKPSPLNDSLSMAV